MYSRRRVEWSPKITRREPVARLSPRSANWEAPLRRRRIAALLGCAVVANVARLRLTDEIDHVLREQVALPPGIPRGNILVEPAATTTMRRARHVIAPHIGRDRDIGECLRADPFHRQAQRKDFRSAGVLEDLRAGSV